MEKRTGWGRDYPDALRNGEWEYRVFTADKKPDTKSPDRLSDNRDSLYASPDKVPAARYPNMVAKD